MEQKYEMNKMLQAASDPMQPLCGKQTSSQGLGTKIRKWNKVISIASCVLFVILVLWLLHRGGFSDLGRIQAMIQQAGPLGPILFILISIFSSYIPVIPLGSMGAIGIAVFGQWPAFWLNSFVSIVNCLMAYLLVRRFGKQVILALATPETFEKYENLLRQNKNYELIFTIAMLMPISPDLILCMIAGLMDIKFSHFLLIVIISGPFSSWCYNTLLLNGSIWLAHLFFH